MVTWKDDDYYMIDTNDEFKENREILAKHNCANDEGHVTTRDVWLSSLHLGSTRLVWQAKPELFKERLRVAFQLWLYSIFVLLCVSLLAIRALADSDQDAIDAGKVSLQTGDCTNAVKFIESVSQKPRCDPNWISLAAQAHDCSGDRIQALDYYKKLDTKLPNQAETRKAIGRLMLTIQREKVTGGMR
jgi:hypothetical protein